MTMNARVPGVHVGVHDIPTRDFAEKRIKAGGWQCALLAAARKSSFHCGTQRRRSVHRAELWVWVAKRIASPWYSCDRQNEARGRPWRLDGTSGRPGRSSKLTPYSSPAHCAPG